MPKLDPGLGGIGILPDVFKGFKSKGELIPPFVGKFEQRKVLQSCNSIQVITFYSER